MNRFDADYWAQRYAQAETGWDTGAATPPIASYFAQSDISRQARILIPGCGNAHEAAHLYYDLGYAQVYLCDWALAPLEAFAAKYPDFPQSQLLHQNFFDLPETPGYDYIIEQTFFCALDPSLRPDYAKKMRRLLVSSGKLVGLLFDFPLTEKGPPFGGSEAEYKGYFEPLFEIKRLERCHNSIKPRQGTELFVCLNRQT